MTINIELRDSDARLIVAILEDAHRDYSKRLSPQQPPIKFPTPDVYNTIVKDLKHLILKFDKKLNLI